MNNKFFYLLVMLASVSAVYGEIQVVKTAFNQDKNKNTAFNFLTAVGFEIHPDNAVALASFAPKPVK